MTEKPTKVVALLEALTEELRRQASSAPEAMYYDQTNSPLPRETHCRLVRQGKLTGFKVAGRIFVLRSEMHDFIEKHRVEPHLPHDSDNAAVAAAALVRLGLKRAG